MAHAYKEIESCDLLKLIPIEDVVYYHGRNLILEIGTDKILNTVSEEKLLEYIFSQPELLEEIKDKLKTDNNGKM